MYLLCQFFYKSEEEPEIPPDRPPRRHDDGGNKPIEKWSRKLPKAHVMALMGMLGKQFDQALRIKSGMGEKYNSEVSSRQAAILYI